MSLNKLFSSQFVNTIALIFNIELSRGNVLQLVLGGIDKYSITVFLEKILRYNYIPTIQMADFHNDLDNMSVVHNTVIVIIIIIIMIIIMII